MEGATQSERLTTKRKSKAHLSHLSSSIYGYTFFCFVSQLEHRTKEKTIERWIIAIRTAESAAQKNVQPINSRTPAPLEKGDWELLLHPAQPTGEAAAKDAARTCGETSPTAPTVAYFSHRCRPEQPTFSFEKRRHTWAL